MSLLGSTGSVYTIDTNQNNRMFQYDLVLCTVCGPIVGCKLYQDVRGVNRVTAVNSFVAGKETHSVYLSFPPPLLPSSSLTLPPSSPILPPSLSSSPPPSPLLLPSPLCPSLLPSSPPRLLPPLPCSTLSSPPLFYPTLSSPPILLPCSPLLSVAFLSAHRNRSSPCRAVSHLRGSCQRTCSRRRPQRDGGVDMEECGEEGGREE